MYDCSIHKYSIILIVLNNKDIYIQHTASGSALEFHTHDYLFLGVQHIWMLSQITYCYVIIVKLVRERHLLLRGKNITFVREIVELHIAGGCTRRHSVPPAWRKSMHNTLFVA